MRTFLKAFTASVLAIAAASVADATTTTITFDDFTGTLTSQYGLTWSNFETLDGTQTPTSSAYYNDVVSPNNVATNITSAPASFSSSSLFTFDGVYLTASKEYTQVFLYGYRDGAQVYYGGVSLVSSNTTRVDFNWTDVDTVTFYPSTVDNLVLDNLILERPQSAVPEPTSWAMMVGGFAMAGGTLRARKRTLRTQRA